MDIDPNQTIQCEPAGSAAGSLSFEPQPETWAMRKDTICDAAKVLQIGLENTQELLIEHDSALGRTTRKNQFTAERLESEIEQMKAVIQKLQAPDGSFFSNQL